MIYTFYVNVVVYHGHYANTVLRSEVECCIRLVAGAAVTDLKEGYSLCLDQNDD